MKFKTTLLAVLMGSLFYAQDYKDKISQEMCSCTRNVKPEGKSQKKLEFELGLCMLKVAKPYHRELKRDYDIDIKGVFNNDAHLTELGEVFAMLMVNECPDIFKTFITDSYLGEDDPSSQRTKVLNGTISKIEKSDFVVFHLTGDNRVLTKLHWISKIESDLDLPSVYASLQNRRVTVSYYTAELFDPKTNQYRSINLITSLRTE